MGLSEGWADPDAEYEVLTGVFLPAAHARLDRTLQDWDALDTKGLGLLALDAAVTAALATFHASVHRLWWLPALGFALAGFFFVIGIRTRHIERGEDPRDLHAKMRDRPRIEAARAMLSSIASATIHTDRVLAAKTRALRIGLTLLCISFAGLAPVLICRP